VRKIPALGLEWIGWAAAALGVWLLTLASVTGADLAVASAAAALCGIAAVATRRMLDLKLRPSPRILRWLRRLPAAIAVDTVSVLSLPWRRRGEEPEGSWQRVPIAPGPEPRDSTSRSAATIILSVPPASFVVHDDSDTGELLVHRLVDSPAGMTEVVRR
jgi:hypothetical protein